MKPEYRNEIELSNPVTSGTGYTILATLVALYGEDGAFDYLKRLRPNVVRYTQSGTAQKAGVGGYQAGRHVPNFAGFRSYKPEIV